jgi:hypothetical protein
MLTIHLVHFAIEPVTTTVALIALGKALGIYGAATGGSVVGKKMAGHSDKEAIKRGIDHANKNFGMAQYINNQIDNSSSQN